MPTATETTFMPARYPTKKCYRCGVAARATTMTVQREPSIGTIHICRNTEACQDRGTMYANLQPTQ